MATTYGTQAAKVLGLTKSTPAPGFVHGTVRTFTEQVTYASQASGDIIVVGFVPKGCVFLGGTLETDTSTGSATIALSSVTLNAAGTATVATAGKYQAAAAYTSTDTPVLIGKTAVTGVAASADDIIGAVIAAAALPASGNLKITIFYANN